MAVSTTITGNPMELGFTLAAAALDASAAEHKRLSALHRRRAQDARRELEGVKEHAARAGVSINLSEEESPHG